MGVRSESSSGQNIIAAPGHRTKVAAVPDEDEKEDDDVDIDSCSSYREKVGNFGERLTAFRMVARLFPYHLREMQLPIQRKVDVGSVHHDQPPRGEGVEAIAGEAAVTDVQPTRPIGTLQQLALKAV